MSTRARFPLMMLKAIRERVGEDMLIELRISDEEFLEGGITKEETVEFCKLIDSIVDIIQLSTGIHHIAKGNIHTIPSYFKPPACNVHVAYRPKILPCHFCDFPQRFTFIFIKIFDILRRNKANNDLIAPS